MAEISKNQRKVIKQGIVECDRHRKMSCWINGVRFSHAGMCYNCGGQSYHLQEFISIGGEQVKAIIKSKVCLRCNAKGLIRLDKNDTGFDKMHNNSANKNAIQDSHQETSRAVTQ